MLMSRDCCPYLDDNEPDGHSVAAPAIGTPRLRRRTDVACGSGGNSDHPTASDSCVACGREDEPPWTVKPARPTRVALSADGTNWIFELVQTVIMVRSARRAVPGNGFCIVLAYKEMPFSIQRA